MRRRGDAWELRVYRGRDALTGREIYRTKTVRGVGKLEAERMLAALVVEDDAPVSGTFGDLAERWYELRAPDWSPKTARETRGMFDRYLAPLMKMPLSKLGPARLDAFYSALRARGGRGGSPLSAASVHRVHTIVRSAMNQGVRWGILSSNPALRTSPGQVEERDIEPPSPEELLRLFDAAEAENPDLVVFLVLAAVTGARRSELCALRWSDLGLGVVTIARGIVEGALDEANEWRFAGHIWPAGWERGNPTALIEKKTKTKRPRTISVDAGTMTVLSEHKRLCEERAAVCGVELPPNAFVFSLEPDGSRPWRPDVVTRQFSKLRTKVGLPEVRLHDLRHFVVTTLLSAGVDQRTVMGRAGHASLASLARYAHFQRAPDQAAAELLGALLQRKPPEP